jgi:hypothetical protein
VLDELEEELPQPARTAAPTASATAAIIEYLAAGAAALRALMVILQWSRPLLTRTPAGRRSFPAACGSSSDARSFQNGVLGPVG